MKPKRLFIIVYIIIGILVATFAVTWYLSSKNPNLDFITYISGFSSFFVALLTAINVYTTSSQIEVANKQLEEMRFERSMGEQPLLLLENLGFAIEKPRFFYTPPEDKYSFQSRYSFKADIKNCSNYPATAVDTTAELRVICEKETLCLSAVTRRNSIIAPGEKQSVEISFSGDEVTLLFDALREEATEQLPRILVTITYKNLCGGFFRIKDELIIAPKPNTLDTIRDWHSRINSAYIEEKESIETLRKIRQDKAWFREFDRIKDKFSSSLSGRDSIEISCVDMPEKYSVSTITHEEYKKIKEGYHYARYIHRAANCQKSDMSTTDKAR